MKLLIVSIAFAVPSVISFFCKRSIDSRHRSLIDVILGTRVVALEKAAPVKQKEAVPENVKPQPKPAEQPDMIMNTMDLHIHSNFSDRGQYNVEEIFQYAKRNRIQTISITDLDCACLLYTSRCV